MNISKLRTTHVGSSSSRPLTIMVCLVSQTGQKLFPLPLFKRDAPIRKLYLAKCRTSLLKACVRFSTDLFRICLQCFDAVCFLQAGCLFCRPTEWWGAGVVVCLEQGADLHTAQLMPLPLIVSCFSKIQIGFTFLVPAYPGSLGQRAVKRVCVCYSGSG